MQINLIKLIKRYLKKKNYSLKIIAINNVAYKLKINILI